MVAGEGYTASNLIRLDSWRMLPRFEFDLSLDIIRAVRDAVGSR